MKEVKRAQPRYATRATVSTTVVGLNPGGLNPGAYVLDATAPEPVDKQVNQYTQTPFDSREYDLNGNLVHQTDGAVVQVNVVYDYRNQMVGYADLIAGVTATYAYDVFGRRIERIVDDGHSAVDTTRYYYDGEQVVEEQDAAGATLATYVYGNYIDEVVSMSRSGVDYFYHGDDMFNVMAVTDATGAVVERYEYQDYGAPEMFNGNGAPIASSAIGNPYLFTGRRYDVESGWYFYRTRYLDPEAGRFTSRDPIGIWGDPINLGNGYSYVGNNPWSRVDPFGESGVSTLDADVNIELARGNITYLAGLAEADMLSTLPTATQNAVRIAVSKFQSAAAAALPPAVVGNRYVPEGGRQVIAKLTSWPKGGQLRDNLIAVQTMIGKLKSANMIDELKCAGVTKEMALAWRNFYAAEAIRVATNPVALARYNLMAAIADLL